MGCEEGYDEGRDEGREEGWEVVSKVGCDVADWVEASPVGEVAVGSAEGVVLMLPLLLSLLLPL